ncbi:MAG TPA: WD40 repeat domain-containing protein, partial [Promineifilum sp.]
GGVYRVAYSPDGTRLAGVGADNVIRIWDAVTGETILAWTGHGEGVSGGFYEGTLDVAYSPDGTRIATAGADGMAKVWDAATGEELLTLAGHSDGLHSIAYSPDGRLIATSSDEQDTTVKVWEAQTGVEIYSLSGHTARAWGLAFSPDASRLVTSGFGGIVKVWDMGTGEELYTLPNQSTSVLDIAFTPDGQHFITTGGSGTRVWRKEDGELVMTLDGGGSVVAAISRDGRWLYTTSLDGMVRVFALQLEDTVALAYERLFRWWRPEECLAYLHTEECPAAPEKFAVEN